MFVLVFTLTFAAMGARSVDVINVTSASIIPGFGTGTSAGVDDTIWGASIAVLSDIDGDGVADVAVSAPREDVYNTSGSLFEDAGNLYILFMNANGTVKGHTNLSSSIEAAGISPQESNLLGTCLATLSDMDGDGYKELAVGANFAESNDGVVYIFYLTPGTGVVSNIVELSATAGGLTEAGLTVDSTSWFGYSCAALPDYDGDGYDELLVGAPLSDDVGGSDGAVYILSLHAENATVKTGARLMLSDTDLTVVDALPRLGRGIAAIPDMDGDGVDEMFVGGTAALFVFFMHAGNFSIKAATEIRGSNNTLSEAGVVVDNSFGRALTSLYADLDGDGGSEVAFGMSTLSDDVDYSGAVFVMALETQTAAVRSVYRISNTHGGLAEAGVTSPYLGVFGDDLTVYPGDTNTLVAGFRGYEPDDVVLGALVFMTLEITDNETVTTTGTTGAVPSPSPSPVTGGATTDTVAEVMWIVLVVGVALAVIACVIVASYQSKRRGV